MKTTRRDVLAIVYSCIAELNHQLPPTAQLQQLEDTVLLDPASGLDSLGVVNLITSIEEQIQVRFGLSIPISLPDSSSSGDPWRNVGALVDFLTDLINNQ